MATINVLGKMTFPGSPNGANNPVMIGAPVIPATSTTGFSLTYNESAQFEYVIPALGVRTVNFGSISTGKFLYIGTDQPVTYKKNGGSEVFSLSAGGFIMEAMASLSALEITAGTQDARVFVVVLGD